jgi:hypothetical protein
MRTFFFPLWLEVEAPRHLILRSEGKKEETKVRTAILIPVRFFWTVKTRPSQGWQKSNRQ